MNRNCNSSRLFALFFVGSALFLATGGIPSRSVCAQEILELPLTHWKESNLLMENVRVQYYEFSNGYGFADLSEQDFRSLVDSIEWSDRESGIRAFACAVMGRVLPDDAPPWPLRTFLCSGGNSRVDVGKDSTVFRHGVRTQKQQSEGFAQVTIGTASGAMSEDDLHSGDFLWQPTITEGMPVPTHTGGSLWQFSGTGSGEVGESWIVESETRLVRERSVTSANGKRKHLMMQLEPIQFPGKTSHWYPTVIVDSRFTNGLLSVLTVLKVQSLEIVNDVTDEPFKVSAHAGTVVVDHSREKVSTTRLEDPAADVNDPHNLRDTSNRRQVIFVLTAGVGGSLMFFLLLRRYSAKHSIEAASSGTSV